MSGLTRIRLVQSLLNNIKLLPKTNSSLVRNLSSSDSEDNRVTLENIDTAKCLNRVTLMGRAIGPAMVIPMGKIEMAAFTLVTNEIRRTRNNELFKRSDFHKIQVYNARLVDKTKKVLQKGSRVLVDGKINYNVRKGEHGNVHFTNIIAERIIFLTGSRVALNDEEASDEEIVEEQDHEIEDSQQHQQQS
ncbi:Single-stranded DNA-binding protein [Sarcoptes scabiei]|uniref:Single-stranded DNA-binding protein, mitochondrial n=1 Tax=Sarcoptes scabiei TaxID=52283 RepID=A0A834V8V3_SARSC|nr:Single-stranded DNA-binding protein [Sarcoptes scabiei]